MTTTMGILIGLVVVATIAICVFKVCVLLVLNAINEQVKCIVNAANKMTEIAETNASKAKLKFVGPGSKPSHFKPARSAKERKPRGWDKEW